MGDNQNIQKSFPETVKFDEKGLVPAIVQDHETGKVLMMAWMNRQSLEMTLEKKRACYWSRSRQELLPRLGIAARKGIRHADHEAAFADAGASHFSERRTQ